MTTWEDVRAAFEARGPLAHDKPGWHGVVIDGALVRVEAVKVREEPWLLFLAMVCYEADLPHRDALALNLRLSVGGLALNGERYELRQVVPLGSANPTDLVKLADELAAEATRLATAVGARARAATLFSTFKE
jgi:hypothetical protein